MKVPNFNVKDSFNNGIKSLKDGYTEKMKPFLDKGIKYTKDLAADSVEFVVKNPKKTGLIAAGTILLASVTAAVVKLVKTNKIKSEHINHQKEIIGALKEEVGVRDEMIGALHDSVEAAHNHFTKLKAEK